MHGAVQHTAAIVPALNTMGDFTLSISLSISLRLSPNSKD